MAAIGPEKEETTSNIPENPPTGLTADEIKERAYRKFSELGLTAPSLQASKEAMEEVFSMTPKESQRT